jgi:hydrogenase/urease accessory protein HupE
MSSAYRALVLVALALSPVRATAHPLAPVLLEVRELADDRVAVAWKTPLVRPRGTSATPVLPSGCETVEPPATVQEGVGLVTRWTARCGTLVGARLGIDGLAEPLTGLVRVVLADGRVVQAVLSERQAMMTVPERPQPWDVVASYVRLGVAHILTGPAHLLFVLGLVLLAGTARRVAGTVSAFTIGHSVTLSLAVLGVTDVPTRAIEVAIAASVLALAVELAREDGTRSLMRRHPWGMAFAFGLLHGLGFAGALREAGLPAGEIPVALLAFNAGIELGQLGFVLTLLAVARLLRPLRPALPAWATRAPVYVMGTLAAYWCFERATVWWG